MPLRPLTWQEATAPINPAYMTSDEYARIREEPASHPPRPRMGQSRETTQRIIDQLVRLAANRTAFLDRAYASILPGLKISKSNLKIKHIKRNENQSHLWGHVKFNDGALVSFDMPYGALWTLGAGRKAQLAIAAEAVHKVALDWLTAKLNADDPDEPEEPEPELPPLPPFNIHDFDLHERDEYPEPTDEEPDEDEHDEETEEETPPPSTHRPSNFSNYWETINPLTYTRTWTTTEGGTTDVSTTSSW